LPAWTTTKVALQKTEAPALHPAGLPGARRSASLAGWPVSTFFVDLVVSGAVLGVGLADTPEAVAAVLGEDFVEDSERTVLRRDYGLVEFSWSRPSAAQPWLAAGFTVQAHRLGHVDVIDELADRYGRFGRRLPFAALGEALGRLGYRLDEVTAAADRPDYRRFWLAESQAAVLVAATGWAGRLAAGDVWSISAPVRPESTAAGDLGAVRQAVKDGLAHLLRLDDADRGAWLDRRQPAAAERTNWWLYLLLVIDGQIAGQPGPRPEWVALKRWLLDQARSRMVFTPAESAMRMAYFVADVRRTDPRPAVTVPSADEVVRACLHALPVGLADVALLDDRRDLRRLDRTAMRHSRQARNLVSAAEQHLHHIDDAGLAAQLRRWLTVKSRLV
jgi:hypothetical protein